MSAAGFAADPLPGNDAELDCAAPQSASRRVDQWLWFARLAKSRSRAAGLCAAGAVAVNGRAVKAKHAIRIGDAISVPQGARRRLVRVRALGSRRGPAAEGRSLYEEIAAPDPFAAGIDDWLPLLADGPPDDADDDRSD